MTTGRRGQGAEYARDGDGPRNGARRLGAAGRGGAGAGRGGVRTARRDTAVINAAHPTPADAGDLLGGYLQAQAADFLRSLRVHRESVGAAELAADAAEAVRRLRRSARRLGATLHTFRPLFDAQWAEQLRTELSWLSGTLAREYTYAARLDRLLAALHRLASDGGATGLPAPAAPSRGAAGGREPLPAGVTRAGALLERRLTLARTRAHSTALQALGSSRFHAVADEVAVLASQPPVFTGGVRATEQVLQPHVQQAHRRLQEAVDALPLARSEHPFHAEALARSLSAEVQSDSAWLHVRLLLRLHRYAQELVLRGGSGPGPDVLEPLAAAGRELDRHHDAAEAAAAAAAAARTPRIASTTAYALGVLHADQRHEVEAARFAFARHWTAADG